jgi:hypothetical protein
MKAKQLIIVFTVLSLHLLAGQKGGDNKWFTIGLRGTAAAPFLINSNEYKDKGIKHGFAFGGGGGAMLGFHFNDWGSINVEGLYTMYSNNLTRGTVDSLKGNSSTKLAYLEIPILFRGEWNFKYVEGGVVIGSLLGATASQSGYKNSKLNGDVDAKDFVNKGNTSLLFGWGTNMMGSGGLMFSVGIRMCYGLSDIVSDLGGKGKPYTTLADPKAATQGYTPTNTAYVGIHLSLDFDLGYFVSSSCGRKHEFQLFGH